MGAHAPFSKRGLSTPAKLEEVIGWAIAVAGVGAAKAIVVWGLHDAARRRRRIAGCQSSAAHVRLLGAAANAPLGDSSARRHDVAGRGHGVGAGGPTPSRDSASVAPIQRRTAMSP